MLCAGVDENGSMGAAIQAVPSDTFEVFHVKRVLANGGAKGER
jgi:hypothetical protein